MLFLLPGLALASCSINFNSALQTHSSLGDITFKNSAKVKGDIDNVLETMAIIDQSTGYTCDTGSCTASNSVVSPLNIGTFQFQSGGNDVTVPNSGSQVLSGSTRNYDHITVNTSGTLTFASGTNAPIYKIERLELKNGVVLNLEPGTYWVREFVANNSADINIIGNGSVTLVVNETIQFKNSTTVNKGGDASDLFIYAFGDVITHNTSELHAFIYSQKTVEMKNSSYVKGAILARDIELKATAIVEYDPNGALNIDLSNICQGSLVDHFRLNTSSQGSYCTPHELVVYAEDNHGQVVDYTGTIILNTGSGTGTWSKISGSGTLIDATADDGLATYQFVESDGGVASFYLHYNHGTSPINISTTDSSNSNLKDDDTEGLIYFPAYKIWLTSSPVVDVDNVSPFTDTITAGASDTVHLTMYGPTGSGCGIMTNNSGIKDMKFWHEYSDPVSGTKTVSVDSISSGTAEENASTQQVTFTEGRATVSINYRDVGLIRLHTAEVGNLGVVGSTGYFVTKPANFVLSIEQNPSAEDASGGVFKTAGDSFSVQVTVVDALGGTVPNYGNEQVPEGVRLGIGELVAPSSGYLGTLLNPLSFTKQSPGVFSSSTVAYSEVGIIKLFSSIADADYLGVGDVTGDNSSNVGRFIPDHFTFSTNNPIISTGCAGCGFTYVGQDLTYSTQPVVTISAKNVNGTVTENYTGNFFKLVPVDVGVTYSSNSADAVLTTTDANTDVTVIDSGDGAGIIRLGDGGGFEFSKAQGVDATPFSAEIRIDVTAQDSDSVGLQPTTATFGGTGSGEGVTFSAGNLFYQGRLVLANAFGSELLNLSIPYVIEFFNGADYVQNQSSQDVLPGGSIILTPLVNGLNTGATNVGQLQGSGIISLTAPNPAIPGDVNIEIDLTSMPYLQHDWPHDGNTDGQFNDNPRSKATFGIYEGDDVMINIRELY